MTQPIDRRRWMQRIAQSMAAWSGARSLQAVDYDKPAPGSEKLTVYRTVCPISALLILSVTHLPPVSVASRERTSVTLHSSIVV